MKNIKTILTYIQLLRKFGYHNLVSFFKLEKLSEGYSTDFYHEMYVGLSDPKSDLQLRLGTQGFGFGFITYEIYDRILDRPVAVFSPASTRNDTVLYPDWCSINFSSERVFVYDKETLELNELNMNLEEDEHFQLMMLSDIPAYEDIQAAAKYVQNTHPLLKSAELCSLVTYDCLDVDFSKHIPLQGFMTEMEIQFPGSTKLYTEAENNAGVTNFRDIQ